ncbi:MAG: hypothetical protein NVS9B13_06310 [Candidatus Acidiferrum sp.]
MKKLLLIAMAAVLTCPSMFPQGKPTDELEIDRQELVNLEHETARALQLNNATFFKRVYSDDFLETTAFGQIIDKQTLVNNIQTSKIKYESFLATDIKVRLYQETAVVNALWTLRGFSNGRHFSKQLRVIHIYINGQHGWHVVASQETPLPGLEQ